MNDPALPPPASLASDELYDAIIVGGGPAGLNAALILGRACKRVAVIDAGAPRNAAARQLHGFLSRDGIRPGELLAAGREQLACYGVEFIADTATGAESLASRQGYRHPTGFSIRTRGGRTLSGRKLLLATGARDLLPAIEGLRECYGVSVHHCPYCDGWEHRHKQLVALGAAAKDAAGLAITLRGWSRRVTVLTDGEPLDEQMRRRLAKCDVAWSQDRLLKLVHDCGRLQAVEFVSGERLPADSLFFNTPHRPQCELAISLGCPIDSQRMVHTGARQRTPVAGLFVAGDADGDVQFLIVAAGEGATAAVAINRELQDEDFG